MWFGIHFRKVIEMFKPGYCGLCCIKFSGEKFCWKHYTGKGHAGLLQRKSYRFLDGPFETFNALFQELSPALADDLPFIDLETWRCLAASNPPLYPLQLWHSAGRICLWSGGINIFSPKTPGQLARTVEKTLVDMVGRFQNVVFDKYRLVLVLLQSK